MSYQECLTLPEIQSIFADEIAAARGTVADTFGDATRLFLRAVLPTVREVRTGDAVNGGVALRATERDVWIHPYVFREVCRNGAIVAHSLQSEHMEDLNLQNPEEAAARVREAVQACCAEEPFAKAAHDMRLASQAAGDPALYLMHLLHHVPSGVRDQLLSQIMDQFAREGDPTRFGVMNAVTAVARDTRDPDLRWRLEELGGGMLAALHPRPVPDDAAVALCGW